MFDDVFGWVLLVWFYSMMEWFVDVVVVYVKVVVFVFDVVSLCVDYVDVFVIVQGGVFVGVFMEQVCLVLKIDFDELKVFVLVVFVVVECGDVDDVIV